MFSGDPSKKFDVVFSVDMRQLLTGLGMKPADVERIMATAEANAKKNIVEPERLRFVGAEPAGDAAGGRGGRAVAGSAARARGRARRGNARLAVSAAGGGRGGGRR